MWLSTGPDNPALRPLTQPSQSDCHSQPDRHSHECAGPVSFKGTRFPGLRSASPGMTILINRQANPANQPCCPRHHQTPPTRWAGRTGQDRTGLNRIAPDRPSPSPYCPEQTPRALDGHHKRTSPQRQWRCRMAGTNPAINDPRFGISERTIAPLATDPARRSGQTDPNPPSQAKPAAPGIAKRHRPDGPRCPEQHPPPSVDAANAPHPKGHTLPHGRHTTPAIDHRPFGIAKRSTSPLTTDPASQSRSDDPVPIQSGRNSGLLILGIVTLHRPD